jgi:hypothetical protein
MRRCCILAALPPGLVRSLQPDSSRSPDGQLGHRCGVISRLPAMEKTTHNRKARHKAGLPLSDLEIELERTGQANEARPVAVSRVAVEVVNGGGSLQARGHSVFSQKASAPSIVAVNERYVVPVVNRRRNRQLVGSLEAVSSANGPLSNLSVRGEAGSITSVELETSPTTRPSSKRKS